MNGQTHRLTTEQASVQLGTERQSDTQTDRKIDYDRDVVVALNRLKSCSCEFSSLVIKCYVESNIVALIGQAD